MSLRAGACVALSLCASGLVCAQDVEGGPGDHDLDAVLNISTLPPILRQKLKRELRIHDISMSVPKKAQAASTGGVLSPAHDDAAISHRYLLTDLGTLGGTESFAYAINDHGQIVGLARLAGDTSTHSFLYSNGTMTDLSPLNSGSIRTVGPSAINNTGQIASGLVVGGVYLPAISDSANGDLTLLGSLGGVTDFGFSGVATSINNSGDAVGYSYTDTINRHAFLYSNGLMTDIGSLGGYSAALGINDVGTVVGFSATETSGGLAHAFVYSSGLMRDIDPLDGEFSESYARGVNNLGQVVGQFFDQDQSSHHAFLFSDDTFRDIGVPESPETVAFAINDRAQIVGVTLVPYEDVCFDPTQGGTVTCTNYMQHAFLHEGGGLVDLNASIPAYSGWELEWAFDINNDGQIVGFGLVNDKFRAFVLTPAISRDQCKKGAWKQFVGFDSQGDCVQFVASR